MKTQPFNLMEAEHYWNSVLTFDGGVNSKYLFTKEEEVDLFLRYNFAKKQIIRGVNKEVWNVILDETKRTLVVGNIGLVLRYKIKSDYLKLDEEVIVADGLKSLLAAIDMFDISRGWKFSTYACNAIFRNYSRSRKYANKFQMEIPHDTDSMDFREGDGFNTDAFCDTMDLRTALGRLDKRERYIIDAMFSHDGKLEPIGQKMNITKERVRQIKNEALEKLRKVLVPT